jgi:photosystem II stability/assembly factor-like uncharacterized protein
MRRAFLLLVAASGAAGSIAAAMGPLAQPGRSHHRSFADDRRRAPGVHRANAAELAAFDRVGRAESLKLERRRKSRAALPSVPSTSWVNLGPSDAEQEVNYFDIAGVDSGRPNTILVDPRDANIVYMAVSGGGVWKTFDFLSADVHWAPTMDTQPNLAVGSLAMDAQHPDTIYVGSGDFVDASGDTILKSTDGGGTWAAPVVLQDAYPSPNGFAAHARAIRQISAVGDRVLAATDVGLFASTDAGASFHLIDLPNLGGAALTESVWSVVPIGGGAYVASGLTACDVGAPPPFVYYGSDPDPQLCPHGNNAEIWRSDDGATWKLETVPATVGTGRVTIAAGPAADPTKTVVYAYVGDTYGFTTKAFWRSTDGGTTWVDATGTLANPTLPYMGQGTPDCGDTDIGHEQTWYNQAIVVDPTNPDHVLVGGNLCGMRTLNGTADSPTWELVSHWLPSADPANLYGNTANGVLPYVHADWHTATAVPTGVGVRVFAGTDGGVFTSENVFDSGTQAEHVTWTNHNHGLATHLLYSVASGDPATGDPFVLFAGLQDNGTRFRANPADPGAFNQPIGGDGTGATVHHSTKETTYFGSSEYNRDYCKPHDNDCSTEVQEADDVTIFGHWHAVPSPIGPARETEEAYEERARERAKRSGDNNREPFLEHFADVETDATGPSVLSHTDSQVFVATDDGNGGYTFVPLSQDLTNDPNGNGINNVVASRTIAGLYGGIGMAGNAPFLYTTAGNTQSTWNVSNGVAVAGHYIMNPSAMDFPPVTPGGKQPGDVFLGGFTGPLDNGMPSPDIDGYLYRTTDGGKTWSTLAGKDPDHRLPAVPVYVVKYDPVTPTTIYAGTQVGVYISLDDGATWDRMGDNFPMVPVRDIYVARNQDFIRVATYGRGLWEIYPSASANQGVFGNGDFDRNLRIDWIDLGAMSARLGETPTTKTAPLYSWILDITGDGSAPVQSIDDSDLQALLAKFGGHP